MIEVPLSMSLLVLARKLPPKLFRKEKGNWSKNTCECLGLVLSGQRSLYQCAYPFFRRSTAAALACFQESISSMNTALMAYRRTVESLGIIETARCKRGTETALVWTTLIYLQEAVKKAITIVLRVNPLRQFQCAYANALVIVSM